MREAQAGFSCSIFEMLCENMVQARLGFEGVFWGGGWCFLFSRKDRKATVLPIDAKAAKINRDRNALSSLAIWGGSSI
jgi:hypothetical protein